MKFKKSPTMLATALLINALSTLTLFSQIDSLKKQLSSIEERTPQIPKIDYPTIHKIYSDAQPIIEDLTKKINSGIKNVSAYVEEAAPEYEQTRKHLNKQELIAKTLKEAISNNDIDTIDSILSNNDFVYILTSSCNTQYLLGDIATFMHDTSAYKEIFQTACLAEMHTVVKKLIKIHPNNEYKKDLLAPLINYAFIQQIIERGHNKVLAYLFKLGAGDILAKEIKESWFPSVKITQEIRSLPIRNLQKHAQQFHHHAIIKILEPYVKKERYEKLISSLKAISIGGLAGASALALLVLSSGNDPKGLLQILSCFIGVLGATELCIGGSDIIDIITI